MGPPKKYVLTENIIKKTVLKYLRSYYKTRNRADAKPSEALINLASEEGIVADGFLRIPLPEDQGDFLVTFEATSYHKLEEVQYRRLWGRLFWDSFAFANLSLLLVLSFFYIEKIHPVQELGLFNVLALYALGTVLAVLTFQQLLAPLARYRYIYALEQFKQYFANEQWIAVAEDALQALPRRYLDELRRQCVNQGVGLLSVKGDLSVLPLITPSRKDLQNHKRRTIEFNPIQMLPVGKVKGFKWGRNNRMARTLKSIISNENINYGRFRRRFYYHQLLLSVISLLFTGFLLFRDYSDLPVKYVNEEKYEIEMEEKALSSFPEVVDFYVDTPAVAPYRPRQKGYIDIEVKKDNLSFPLTRNISRNKAAVFFLTEEGEPLTYDCSRIKNMPGGTFAVLIRQVQSREEALQWINRMADLRLPVGFFRNACFNPKDTTSLSVIFGSFFDNRKEALQNLEDVKKELKKARIPMDGMKIVRFL